MEHLCDEGIELLGRKASEGMPALAAYLDHITGAADARRFGDSVETCLLHQPSLFASALRTMYVDELLNVVRKGDIMDRLTACLRILRIPASQMPSDAPDQLMLLAQRHLSGILVDHPVLMHNRIMVRGHHFAKAEFGPIATILAETPRAEFPRLGHGIAADRLQAFAKHPCLRVGLTQEAPNPLRIKETKLLGRTMLNAVVVSNSFTPRARMLGSILELDALRAVKGKRPSSLLSCKGASEDALRGCFANSFLAECGVDHLLAEDLRQSAPDFMGTLQQAGITNEAWFLPALESRIARWATGPSGSHKQTMQAIALGLTLCQPAALSSAAGPVSVAPVVRWLIAALLDCSPERAASLGKPFKGFTAISVDGATAFIEAMAEIDPESAAKGIIEDLITSTISCDAPLDQSKPWLAAIRAHTMRCVIARAGAPAPGSEAGAEPPRPRRTLSI